MNIFISYSHKDEKWKNELNAHLEVLKNSIKVEIWDDRQLIGGDDWKKEIERSLSEATIAIMMVSQHFLSSKFIIGVEVPAILESRIKKGLIAYPIIVRDCAWQTVSWLSEIQARPNDGIALASVKPSKRDEYFKEIATEIYNMISEFDSPHPQSTPVVKEVEQNLEKPTGNIIDEMYNALKKFEGLGFVNPNIIADTYPFNIANHKVFHYHNFSLQTLNPQIYHLLSTIKIKNKKIHYTKNFLEQYENLEDDYQTKLNYVLGRLNQSLILFICCFENPEQVIKDSSTRSLRFDLSYYEHRHGELVEFDVNINPNKTCDCLLCNLKNLDFSRIIEKLKTGQGTDERGTIDAFLHYKVASDNFKESYILLDKIREQGQDNFIQYFIASYNLLNIYGFLEGDYFLDDKGTILEKIETIDLDKILSDAENIDRKVLESLIEIRFEIVFNKISRKVDDLHTKILEVYNLYEKGGYASGQNHVQFLHHELWLLTTYFNYNHLIFDDFSIFHKVIKKIFEALIVSYVTNDRYPNRLSKFNELHLRMAILNLPTEDLKKILEKYEITDIKVDEECYMELLLKTKNLLQSNHYQQLSLGKPIANKLFKSQINNHHFSSRFVRAFSNLFLILSIVDFKRDDFKPIVPVLMHFLEIDTELFHYPLKYLSRFCIKNGHVLDTQDYMKILDLINRKERYQHEEFTRGVCWALDNNYAEFKIENEDLIKKAILIFTGKNYSKAANLIFYWNVSNVSNQKLIAEALIEVLRKYFSFDLYYELVMRNIIQSDTNDLFEKCLGEISKKSKTEFHNSFFGVQHRNYQFNWFIKLLYSFDIDRRDKRFKVFEKLPEYFDWLLRFDFEEYDYSNFNPQWLLNWKSETYFAKFKGVNRIKSNLKTHLRKNSDKELAEIYFKL